MSKILYVGSGNSTKKITTIDISQYSNIIAVNNAWRISDFGIPIDYWIHSGDFPEQNKPRDFSHIKNIISYNEYKKSVVDFCKKMNISTIYPEAYVGYTIFFQGLIWIFMNLQFDEIHLLGFDHDYNLEKTNKWRELGQPNPQNHFLCPPGRSIIEWTNELFAEYPPDFFYGHGTPDPLRLSTTYLKEKFINAKKYARQLNKNIFNISGITTDLNIFDQISPPLLGD